MRHAAGTRGKQTELHRVGRHGIKHKCDMAAGTRGKQTRPHRIGRHDIRHKCDMAAGSRGSVNIFNEQSESHVDSVRFETKYSLACKFCQDL
jgi:hypothetical protein